jgi:NADH-quinone oxidoreductase subunit J
MSTGVPFYILAVLTVASAIAAMSLRNLVHCVLCLVLTFTGLAALYLRLDAQFVGLAQILVYVGAVAILIVFAILLTQSEEKSPGTPLVSASWWVGLFIGAAVLGSLVAAIKSSSVAAPRKPIETRKRADLAAEKPAKASQAPVASVKSIGLKLLAKSDNYVLPLEVTGLLLTAAMIGAAVIAMPEKRGKA